MLLRLLQLMRCFTILQGGAHLTLLQHIANMG